MTPFHDNDATYQLKHVVHVTKNSGCRFIGEFGSISIDLCDGLLRIHDGVTAGGIYLSPLIKNCAGNLPITPITPPPATPMPSTVEELCITHGLGVYPVVQAINAADGTVDTVEVRHTDVNTFCVLANAPHPDYLIVYRV